jgi:hypothetical protein
MKTIIIDNFDRQHINLHFMINHKNELIFNDNIIEKYKDLFYKELKFEMFFSEKHTFKYNYFINCKVIHVNKNSIYFTFEKINDGLTEKDILPIIRKQKLKTINENT